MRASATKWHSRALAHMSPEGAHVCSCEHTSPEGARMRAHAQLCEAKLRLREQVLRSSTCELAYAGCEAACVCSVSPQAAKQPADERVNLAEIYALSCTRALTRARVCSAAREKSCENVVKIGYFLHVHLRFCENAGQNRVFWVEIREISSKFTNISKYFQQKHEMCVHISC